MAEKMDILYFVYTEIFKMGKHRSSEMASKHDDRRRIWSSRLIVFPPDRGIDTAYSINVQITLNLMTLHRLEGRVIDV